jgi:trans-AT polyketide synthase/acyltransferase/oxidoreductase domain-containing protein
MALIYVFPGQGSQSVGMGSEFFNDHSHLLDEASDILGYSIRSLLLEGPREKLTQTQYTQPALYVVNALYFYNSLKQSHQTHHFAIGHSVGEYNALLSAGVFDFATGLRLVQKRGELMSQAVSGGMAAVIGLTEKEIKEILEENALGMLDLANLNAPDQIVISGPKDDIASAKTVFEKAKARLYMPLPVGGAFHSRYMKGAEKEFGDFAKQFVFSPLKVPVIANVTARPYENEKILETLEAQISSPVRWMESVEYLLKKEQVQFVEMGPGKVAQGLIKKIRENFDQNPPASLDVPILDEPGMKLGDMVFKKRHGLRYAYLAGAMFGGIASVDLLVRMAKSGMMGFFGSGSLSLSQIEEAILRLQNELKAGEPYGINLLNNIIDPTLEESTVDLFLKYGITRVEASAFMAISLPLVKYRVTGLKQNSDGTISSPHKIFAKVSHPDVARGFLNPAPQNILDKLLLQKKITAEEARLASLIPMAEDICIESDSGGHTKQGVAQVLLPAMLLLRDQAMQQHGYKEKICIGAGGGIGTPQAVVASFMLGADYVLTGSINQCTVEAGTSDLVKDMLEGANVHDTEMAPSPDMFEIGSKVQVFRKGTFFPARANRLYDLYRNYDSIESFDSKTRSQIEENYFRKSCDEVYEEVKTYYRMKRPSEIEKAEGNPKYKMVLIFRWYFAQTHRYASRGDKERKVDFQIHCGPALGAFNQWVKGTKLENWRNRHVDEIGALLMNEASHLLKKRFDDLKAVWTS